jgi:pantetheine-phosphate adenylyltransferase
MVNKVTAIYPGSFDPPTKGHIDIIRRAALIFNKIIVAISRNQSKEPVFAVEERKDMLKESIRGMKNVEVDSFSGLLVDYLKRKDASVIIRGLRAVSDFEYEFQMALMNRNIDDSIETVFLMPDEAYTYLSSSLVKEVSGLGGDVSQLVPPVVNRRLKAKNIAGKRGKNS